MWFEFLPNFLELKLKESNLKYYDQSIKRYQGEDKTNLLIVIV